ncbi:MAG: class I SAM-dependent methyltransferase, partial [Candidatus Omnitrophota bacterium]
MGRGKKNIGSVRSANGDRDAVRRYWEDPNTRSIIDTNLHTIEIDTACRYLRKRDSVADIGCGNGIATVSYAKKALRCTGFERSDHLRKQAIRNVKRSRLKNVEIQKGDILTINKEAGRFDRIITQRVLINLASWEEQKRAIMNVHGM